MAKTQVLPHAKPAHRSRFALPWYVWSLLAVATAYGLAFAMHWDDRGRLWLRSTFKAPLSARKASGCRTTQP